MMRNLLITTCFLTTIFLGLETATAQLRVVRYSENFAGGTTYCPGTSNYDNWVSFRRALDTSTVKFTSVTLQGDNNATAVTGRVCNNEFLTRRIAESLRAGTIFNVACNGNTWDIGGAGNCFTGCASSTDQVALSVRGAGTSCACANPSWSLNACIGNANWGGVNTNNCPPPTQRITLTFIRPPALRDMGCTGIGALDRCIYTQNIFATFTSGATADIDSFQYYVKVNSTTYGPFANRSKLRLDSSRNIQVFNNFTFTRNTLYTISVWSANPNGAADGNVINDTFRTTLDFRGTLDVPNAIDTVVCGSQRVRLRGIPTVANDPLVWFSDRRRSNVLGYGNNFLTPFLASGAQYKFYLGSFNGLTTVRANLGAGTNGQNGAMFDIRPVAGDINIDSIYFECRTAAGSAVAVDVYLRRGSYTDAGAASTSTMWTKIYSGNVTSRGTGNLTTNIPAKILLNNNTQYAIYVNTPNDVLGYANGNFTLNNSDLSVSGGFGIGGTFAGTFNPRMFNGALFYTKPNCPSGVDSALVTVNPAPFGAKMSRGVPFQTSPKKSGSGAMGLPQVVAFGDTLAWNLDAPTGYLDGDHGTTWKIKSTSLVTQGGRSLTNYTWTDPSSSSPGMFVYTPSASEIDTNLIATVSFQDLGTFKCDSAVVFYMYVAPLPVPDYTRTRTVCDGDPVEFINKSKIQSGFIDYKWYFGDGDSSEAIDPVHFYPSGGVYYLKMNAISSIYGYVRSKLDTITVTKLPTVDFKVVNACEKGTHLFTNRSSTTSGTLTYKWNFGTAPGVQSTLKDPTFKYTNPGQYKVTLIAEANGCPATLVKNAYLFPTPKSSFTYPSDPGTKFCSNYEVPFTNTSTLLSGNLGQKWEFGDGEVGTVRNPSHLFKTGGKYTVKLVALSDFSCADTSTKTIDIGSAPVVSWTNGQVCDQTPTQFTNNTPAISGFTSSPSWTFGDGGKSGADNPSYQYTVLGPKNVKLVVSVNNGCKDSFEKIVNVGVQATVDFSVANTCSGQAVQFDNKTSWKQGNIVYEWDFGDGSPLSNASDPLHTYTTATSFAPNVKLRAIVDGACESIVTKPLQVFQLPSCAFTITDDWTPGEGFRTIKVQAANTTYPFYRFKFSDGGSINASSGVYQFPYEGDFTVTLYARNSADCECNTSQVKAIRNSVGVENLKGGEVRLFPNPSTGLVNIEAGSAIKGVEVYNVLGEKAIVTQSISGQSGNLKFNGLANGIYLVKITTDLGVVTQRVTITK